MSCRIYCVLTVVIGMVAMGCSDTTNGDETTVPVILDGSDYTYTLLESPGDIPLWTTPCTHKITAGDRPPEETGSGLLLSAAQGEFEPVQLIVGPSSGSVKIQVEDFPNLGADQRIELAQVGFEQGWAEYLNPISSGAPIQLDANRGQPIWITVFVPEEAPAGNHETEVLLTVNGVSVRIPLKLYVFDFTLPSEIHFASQLNVSVGDLIPENGTIDDAKTMLFEHRLTPKSVTWPSGFNWNITWDNSQSHDPCNVFWDEPNEPDEYSLGWLAPRYILGEGWNGVGFPNAMLFQFVDNSTPRPDSFCGISRDDHYGSDEYNAEWGQYLSHLETYLVENGLVEKGYYYVQNEPQNDEDHALAAYLCSLAKEAAPSLRIAVSEEPKPEIAEHDQFPCGYDIWIAHVRAYEQNYAWQRQQDHGEIVWIYSLDHDPDPYFNPTRVDIQGIHQRIIPWVSWTIRARGWAYYDGGRFFDGSRPTIRAELIREGFEDYEYLYLANNRDGTGSHPSVFQDEPADPTARSVASSLTSFTRDGDALMQLRYELGRYIEGTTDSLPVLEAYGDVHPRDAYYINFQDPAGEPTEEPLVVGGNTYIKIGWEPYNDDTMYGWYGENVGTNIAAYGYDQVDGYTEAQKSYVYDDYGRDNLFEFAIENGTYSITVGAGRPGRAYPDDPHTVIVEGIPVIDDEPTAEGTLVFERTVQVEIVDGMLSVEMGGLSPSTGNWSYTFLSFLKIELAE